MYAQLDNHAGHMPTEGDSFASPTQSMLWHALSMWHISGEVRCIA